MQEENYMVANGLQFVLQINTKNIFFHQIYVLQACFHAILKPW